MVSQLIDGRQIGLREWGEGPAALMLHCSLAHAGAWSGVAATLQDRMHLTAMDLPGHGNSGCDMSVDMLDQAIDMARSVLERMDGPVDLIGHSFGGLVALHLAVRYPEAVRSLSLFEPVCFRLLSETRPGAFAPEVPENAALQAFLDQGDIDAAAHRFLSRWGSGIPYEALPGRQRDYIRERIRLVVELNGNAIRASRQPLTIPALNALKVPCLLMDGAKSPPVIREVSAMLADAIPRARYITFAEGDHMCPISRPNDVAGAISEFLFGQ